MWLSRAGVAAAFVVGLLVATGASGEAVQTFDFGDSGLEINTFTNPPINQRGGVDFDIDGDGFIDINVLFAGSDIVGIAEVLVPLRKVDSELFILGRLDETNQEIATRLSEGETFFFDPETQIGFISANPTQVGYRSLSVTGGGEFFDLLTPQRGFVGFVFEISDNLHYGWMDLTLDATDDFHVGSVIIHGLGYETTPDTPIAAGSGDLAVAIPEPASVSLLLVGATVLLRRRCFNGK